MTETGNQALRDANRAVMTELLHRLGEQDFKGACELLSEDVLCDWPYPPADFTPSSIRGRDAVQEFFSSGMMAFEPYRYEISQVYELVDPAFLIAEYHSNSRYKPSGAPSSV